MSYRVNPHSADRNTSARTTIHRSSCSWAQYNWPGPFDTMEEAQAWAESTPYPVHYCLKCDPRSDTSKDTSDPIPTPQLVRDLEDGEVRQHHVRSHPAPLKVPGTERRTPWNSAPKVELSKVDETLRPQSIPSNEGSTAAGYERRRRLLTFAGIVALVLAFVVGLILTNGDGENGSTGGTQEHGSRWEKQLYYDMAVAEDRGDLDALNRSGGCAQDTSNMDVATYTSLSKQLMARYGDQVLAKHGVSRDHVEGCDRTLGDTGPADMLICFRNHPTASLLDASSMSRMSMS